jgi:acetyl-CoA carboxylase biotin carboxyl carrier protein
MTAPGDWRRWVQDGRAFRRIMVAKSVRCPNGDIEVRSPTVGLWRHRPAPGALVMPGTHLGELEVLGVLHELHADDICHGLVISESPAGRLARVPVDHGQVLVVLDPSSRAVIKAEAEAEAGPESYGLVFRAPSSGRFYSRPAPDKPAFVEVGQEIQEGNTVCLLEIMKTFHRIGYGGPDLPHQAKVARIVPEDGADVEIGDPILELSR